jgi:hypothetical protein
MSNLERIELKIRLVSSMNSLCGPGHWDHYELRTIDGVRPCPRCDLLKDVKNIITTIVTESNNV